LSFALTVDCKPYVKNLVARRANEKPPHGTISFLEHTMEAVLVIALGTDFKFLTSVHSMYLVIHLTNLQMLVVLVGMVRKFPARSEPVDQNLHIVTGVNGPFDPLFHLVPLMVGLTEKTQDSFSHLDPLSVSSLPF
jgi:hypothetical protein